MGPKRRKKSVGDQPVEEPELPSKRSTRSQPQIQQKSNKVNNKPQTRSEKTANGKSQKADSRTSSACPTPPPQAGPKKKAVSESLLSNRASRQRGKSIVDQKSTAKEERQMSQSNDDTHVENDVSETIVGARRKRKATTRATDDTSMKRAKSPKKQVKVGFACFKDKKRFFFRQCKSLTE